LSHVAFAGITHEPAALLAEELCALAPPGLARVFFSDDGSTAIEAAVKICLQFWAQNGRPTRRRFVALSDAFHGETLGATALGGVEIFRRPFAGALLECIHVPPGNNGYAAAFDALHSLLRAESKDIAACVVEPMVQGAGGMRIYQADYLRALRQVTRDHDVFLVADEVFTGYGRTGPMWACQHAEVSPDILCLAKGFTAGMLPMAATLTTQRIFEGFLGADDRAFFHGHTYCGHALGAAVAREVLAVFRDEQVLEHVPLKASRIREVFEQLSQLPQVSTVRTLGMVGALELRAESGYLSLAGQRVCQYARARGLYLRPLGNVIYITPPLNISDTDLEELLEILSESIRLGASP
jgi:adenosylmethionine-8-amino-7-oxononanoate aminotransferase